jgi:hypothetical protein
MSLRPRFIAAVLLLLVAGCSTPPERYPFADLTYGHLPPIRLDVAVVDVVNDYRAPLRAPNVEHLFPVRPADAARRWARDRLVPVGSSGVARFTILQASVVEVPLDRSGGLQGFLTKDQSERYDAVIEVRLDLENAGGLRTGTVMARAARSQTVAENATLNERERVWYALTEALMNDLNAELERNIDLHLQRFLR